MPVIKKFVDLCDEVKELHRKKNNDYAEEGNKFFNFEVQAQFLKWFEKSSKVDQAFACIVGLKIARLAQLLQEGRVPNNESTEDTFKDLFVYIGLWYAWQFEEKEKVKKEGITTQILHFNCPNCGSYLPLVEGKIYPAILRGNQHKFFCSDLCAVHFVTGLK